MLDVTSKVKVRHAHIVGRKTESAVAVLYVAAKTRVTMLPYLVLVYSTVLDSSGHRCSLQHPQWMPGSQKWSALSIALVSWFTNSAYSVVLTQVAYVHVQIGVAD